MAEDEAAPQVVPVAQLRREGRHESRSSNAQEKTPS